MFLPRIFSLLFPQFAVDNRRMNERQPPNFYASIDTTLPEDFDVRAFEREYEVDEMQLDLRIDAYLRVLAGQLPRD